METLSILLICVELVQLFIVPIYSASRNAQCITPNNESGRCIPVKSCPVITNALASGSNEAIQFAQKSQCGYDSVPLVCCGSTGLRPSLVYEHRLLPSKDQCGVDKSIDRIIGGESTDVDEFPWIVLLRYRDTFGEDAGFRCGGSLINPRYVLTAAHCIVVNANQGITLNSVRLGEWRISTNRDCLGKNRNEKCSEPVVDVGVQRTIPHLKYNRKTRHNDIGLVRLQRNVKYSDFIQPICLPPPSKALPNVGTNLIVAGWGSTENNATSDVKLKVAVPLVASSECAKKIGSRGSISENQLCAGGVQGKDSCQGDSGGPLMNFFEQNGDVRWVQEGVISWGIGCGVIGYPGVYTKVSKYTTWIVDNMVNF